MERKISSRRVKTSDVLKTRGCSAGGGLVSALPAVGQVTEMSRYPSSLKRCRNEGRRGSLSFGGHSWGKEEANPNEATGEQEQKRSDNVLSTGREVESKAGDSCQVANGLMKEDEAGKPRHKAQT